MLSQYGVASYIIDWNSLTNNDGQCPLSLLFDERKLENECQDTYMGGRRFIISEYATYRQFKNDLEPLIEIAKLVAPELNLQLIDGWLSPRMMYVFTRVVKLYHKMLEAEIENKIIVSDETDSILVELTCHQYWPTLQKLRRKEIKYQKKLY